MENAIELKNVSFAAQNRFIVRGFSHQFEEGKSTALVGPSGSGKSTVLKLAAGVLVPTEGEVYFRDKDIYSMSRKENLGFRREASMVFQDSALWANQSLYQILELPMRIHFPQMSQADIKKRMNEVLSEVGYRRELGIRPDRLSMGEQKLIAFARAMMCRPVILFLDEWTESLDESASRRLISLVQRHQEEEKTVIFVCHNFRIVRSLADYIIMIVGGALHRQFTRQELENDGDLVKHIEEGIAG